MKEPARPPRPYNHPTYKANRALLLATNPPCAICSQPATTADHIIELDRGGTHDLGNLQALCRSCNSRKGAQWRNAKHNLGPAAAEATMRAFSGNTKTPPSPYSPLSPKQPEPAQRSPIPADGLEVRDMPPRLETITVGEQSWGPLVAAWSARVLGVELMPWQRRVLDRMLGLDETGELAVRSSLVSVARQNGKTQALKALIGWWLTEGPVYRGGPQLVVSTAHTLDLAVHLFESLAPTLIELFGGKGRWSYGRNTLTMPDGSEWAARAATPVIGHGLSIDLAVADEVWDVSADVIDQGLMPAQRARRRPLLSAWSTAGTEASSWMLRQREAGIRQIEKGEPSGFYFAEWSPPPNLDPMTPEAWPYANPALGHTITDDTLVQEAQLPNTDAFLRASVNLWITTDRGWLPNGTWEKLVDEPPAGPELVWACDAALDGLRHVGVRAWQLDDGRVHVDTAFVVRSEGEMWEAVATSLPARTTLAITPQFDLHTPAHLRSRRTIVGYSETMKWTGIVRNLILDGKVTHSGSNQLAEHMARAVAAPTRFGMALQSARSPGPIELARCAVWAIALASKTRPRARAVVATGTRKSR